MGATLALTVANRQQRSRLGEQAVRDFALYQAAQGPHARVVGQFGPTALTVDASGDSCHAEDMPSRSSKDHDFATVARRVVEQAIGEQMNGDPLPDPNAGKNPAAVALGKLGGAKGGKARAARLTAEQRADIARIAAAARWKKTR